MFSEWLNEDLNYVAYFIRDDGSIHYWGYLLKLIENLSKNFNFKTKFNPFIDFKEKYYYKNLPVDLFLVTVPHFSYAISEYFIVQPYIFEDQYLAIPIGESYSGYEKFLLPFDSQTWWWIFATFASAFTVILGLRFFKTSVRDFVIGTDVKTPFLNIAIIFFGLSQISLPKRNFARFCVINFMIFSLIIRTAWQGKTFEFLHTDLTKPEVKSMEEMIERNFTFYVKRHYLKLYGNMELLDRYTISFILV